MAQTRQTEQDRASVGRRSILAAGSTRTGLADQSALSHSLSSHPSLNARKHNRASSMLVSRHEKRSPSQGVHRCTRTGSKRGPPCVQIAPREIPGRESGKRGTAWGQSCSPARHVLREKPYVPRHPAAPIGATPAAAEHTHTRQARPRGWGVLALQTRRAHTQKGAKARGPRDNLAAHATCAPASQSAQSVEPEQGPRGGELAKRTQSCQRRGNKSTLGTEEGNSGRRPRTRSHQPPPAQCGVVVVLLVATAPVRAALAASASQPGIIN